MALILSMKKGSTFYVAETPIVVEDVHSNAHFVLRMPDGTTFDVIDDKMVEVLPEVFISVGTRPEEEFARVVIEAPRSITILREKLKKRGPRDG